MRALQATAIQSGPANIATAIDNGVRVRRPQFEFSVPAGLLNRARLGEERARMRTPATY